MSTACVADRFVFEQGICKSISDPQRLANVARGKRPRDDCALANQATAKHSIDKIVSASSASAQKELNALRGALASAEVLLKAKQLEEAECRRRVYL